MADSGKPKGGLGRGLGALIPSGERTATGPETGSLEVEIDRIDRNPWQPRQELDSDKLRELAESIREHGVIQPLVVCRISVGDLAGTNAKEERFQLVAGERRLEAARLAGLARVPVVVRSATPVNSLEIALVENLQRLDLGPLESAEAYHRLMVEFGLTQEQVSQRVGKSRPAVANALRLLGLPGEVKAAIRAGRISEGHARALLGLGDDAARREALGEVVDGKLSVRSTEELVRRRDDAAQRKEGERSGQDEIRSIEDAFRRSLGTRVSLIRRGEGGQLVIHFYSEEQLQSLYDLLVKE